MWWQLTPTRVPAGWGFHSLREEGFLSLAFQILLGSWLIQHEPEVEGKWRASMRLLLRMSLPGTVRGIFQLLGN